MWGVGRHAQAFMWFLVFVAVWSAYAFDDRRAILLHLATVVAVAWYRRSSPTTRPVERHRRDAHRACRSCFVPPASSPTCASG